MALSKEVRLLNSPLKKAREKEKWVQDLGTLNKGTAS